MAVRLTMKLLDLLNIPVFAQCKVLAGTSGLERSVHSVNIMDAPDIIHFLKPNELLLTTAYVLKDRPDALETLVSNMHEVGCAGLAVKTKRFLREIPQQALDAAERLQFPIIELPLEHTLGELVHQSVSYILEKTTEDLKYALESHRRFSDIVMSGKGLPEIIGALSELLGEPVLLLSSKLEPIARSFHFKRQPQYRELSARLPGALPSPLFTADAPYQLSLLEPVFFRGQRMRVYPIFSYQTHGALITLGPSHENLRLSKLAIEQAINVIRFEMLKTQAVKEKSWRYKNEFFSDLAEGLFRTDEDVVHRGRRYGLNGNQPIVCVVGRKDPPPGSNWTSAQVQKLSERDRLYDWLKMAFQKHDLTCCLFMKNDSIVLLLKNPPTTGLPKKLSSIIENIYQQHGVSLSFGVGKQVEKLTDIPLTFKEAAEALEFGGNCQKRQFVQLFHGRELSDLFRLLNVQDLQAFYKDTFLPLESLEDKEREDLLQTLHVYYDHHCSIAETAKRLYIHRNTVIYRLDKCRQLFGHEMTSPSASLRIRTAFLIKPML
ncbi:PucR family transcriptional regulator [Paenibacillus piri]|uniref:PucR family transcriptional regulator n=1 Tax=Paenibacillus piri TaxID=2547395 RepID=A0A4R5KJ29_9BACL|nr:PucR family transcriptional regulator [Paenibacillus piri]TDF94447.1 PucR family transcriptional regulator [Paenibacillus piri]